MLLLEKDYNNISFGSNVLLISLENGNYPRPVKRFHSKNIPKPRRSSDASASSIRNPRSASSTPSGQVSGGFNKSLKSNEANQIGKIP